MSRDVTERAATMKEADRDFSGFRVTVMGLGRFGGSLGAIRFLAERGARVTVTDTQTEASLTESLAQLDGIALEAVHLGGHREEDFSRADLVVASPAVPRGNRFLLLAAAAGIRVTSEMNLFWEHNRAPVVAVTGSNGKSTTTALTHAILSAALEGTGRTCHLGGNIGRSLLPMVDEISPDDLVVLELSSFQLEDLDRLRARPRVAVVTNFAPNHLDWHGTVENYRRAKQAILRWQARGDAAVLNQDDGDVAAWPMAADAGILWFGLSDSGRDGAFLRGGDAVLRRGGGEDIFSLSEWLTLPGRHNVQNALAATCAATAAGADLVAVQRGITQYQPLPHRLQFICERAGRRFYNDSLATTPESAIVALDAFSAPIVLLAGGYDKKVDLDALARAIAHRVKTVALMGQTGPALAESVARHTGESRRPDGGPTRRVCADFPEAFAWSVARSAPGDVVLLSPGCASYDWFRNFADRGEQFMRLAEGCLLAD